MLINLLTIVSVLVCAIAGTARADDTLKLQTLFNEAQEHSTLTIPPGSYTLDGKQPIELKSNLTVIATGARFVLPKSLEDQTRIVLFSSTHLPDTPQNTQQASNRVAKQDAPFKNAQLDKVSDVTRIPGLVAFWDFVERESAGQRRFTAHVPTSSPTNYPLDAANYIKDFWGVGREATYNDFPQLGRGPFGNAVRIMKESDPNFRPFFYVPRSRLHDTPLDIKGAGKSVTVVVWAIRESGNHALAGIWHEGTDLKQSETATIAKVEPGQRQYALFAGLNKQGSACGHVSENGASSFLNRYALHKCNSADVSPEVSADAPMEILDGSWQCFAMTFDHEKDELTGWLNGIAGDRWIENPKSDKLISSAYNAYMQGYFAKLPGKQNGEDETFPKDQYYNPPEDKLLKVAVISESERQRIELREYRYTKIEVTMRDGKEVARDLVSLRLNPWWYPHDLYTPKDVATGGPFTIGRVIHSSRSVGFTGWIGGVAVFNRALNAAEIEKLESLRKSPMQKF